MAGEGNRGSSAGMRFNPREAPEFVEEERNLGRDDPEGKFREEEKKLNEKEERHRKIAGLQHIRVQSKKRTKPKGDNQRNDEELSELTGPASSTGEPLDVATGARTGTGSALGTGGFSTNIMQASEDVYKPDSMILVKDSEKKVRAKTKGTIEERAKKHRSKKTHKRRKGRSGSVEASRFKSSGTGKLNIHSRTPHTHTGTRGGSLKIVGGRGQSTPMMPRLSSTRSRSGRVSFGNPDPRKRRAIIERSRRMRLQPTQPLPPPIPFQTGATRSMQPRGLNPGGGPRRNTALQGPAPIRQPRTAGTPMGREMSHATSLAGGTASPILASEEFMRKAKLSRADIAEMKMLVRQLKRLIREGKLFKSHVEESEDGERPSPNAHRRQTSHATGATETDPDDDPRFWGAHPAGLLVARRGHQ